MKREIVDSFIRAAIQILSAAAVFLHLPIIEKLLAAFNLASQNMDEVYNAITVIIATAIGVYSIFVEPSKVLTESGTAKINALKPSLDRFKAREEAKK